jgi:hypothetical protein
MNYKTIAIDDSTLLVKNILGSLDGIRSEYDISDGRFDKQELFDRLEFYHAYLYALVPATLHRQKIEGLRREILQRSFQARPQYKNLCMQCVAILSGWLMHIEDGESDRLKLSLKNYTQIRTDIEAMYLFCKDHGEYDQLDFLADKWAEMTFHVVFLKQMLGVK